VRVCSAALIAGSGRRGSSVVSASVVFASVVFASAVHGGSVLFVTFMTNTSELLLT